jgi:hypothetical protein
MSTYRREDLSRDAEVFIMSEMSKMSLVMFSWLATLTASPLRTHPPNSIKIFSQDADSQTTNIGKLIMQADSHR